MNKLQGILGLIKLLLLLLLLLIYTAVQAQKVQSDSVIVNTVFQPTIADAYKINDNPQAVDSVVKKPPMSYAISPKVVSTTFSVDPIRPAVMVNEPLTKLYRSLLKLGIGTYTTPYGEYFYNNLRSKELNWGLHLKHISSAATLENTGTADYSDNLATIYGKKFLRKHTLGGELGYKRNVLHFYGYDPLANTIEDDAVTRQQFNYIAPQLRLASHYTDSSKTNYKARLRYYKLTDNYNASEDNVLAEASFKTYVEGQRLDVGISVDHYHNKDAIDTTNNTIVQLSPSFSANGRKWSTSLGVTLCTDIASKSKFYFYPSIDFNYDIIDNILVPYAGLSGGLQKNSLKSLSDENPFIETALPVVNTSKAYDLYGGIRGTIGSKVYYNARASLARHNNMLFYVTNFAAPILDNRFNVVADDVDVTTLHGELQFQADEKLKLSAKGDLFSYKMGYLPQAWHKPGMQMTFSANYNLADKIVAKADVFVYGKRHAFGQDIESNGSAVELKGVTDINIGLEYRYTKILSAFINFNNLASTRYYKWYNYPTHRINILGGVTYAF